MQVWEGEGRVLLQQQKYRLTFSVEPKSHQLSGTLENQKTGDRFLATGSLLPTSGGAELTAYLSAGGGAKLRGLAAAISDALGFRVEVASPWLTVQTDQAGVDTGYLQTNAPEFTVPLGLALRGVNSRG